MSRTILGCLTLSVLLLGCGGQPERPAQAPPGQGNEVAVNRAANHADAHDHAHEHDDEVPEVSRAVCVLLPMGESEVSGVLHFRKEGDVVQIRGTVRGLTPGNKHGFHIHQWGDLTDSQEGLSAGGHFNPTGAPHGHREAEERHVGDLGNLQADDEGVANVEIDDHMIRLSGSHSIVGRSVVVHRDEDKFTQPVGDAGPRIAVGVIGVADPDPQSN